MRSDAAILLCYARGRPAQFARCRRIAVDATLPRDPHSLTGKNPGVYGGPSPALSCGTVPASSPRLSQEPAGLDLAWRAGDAVTLQFLVEDADWTGTYAIDIRTGPYETPVLASLTVTAVLQDPDTLFTLTMSAEDSLALGAGTFAWDLRDTVIPLHRLSGTVYVSQAVTR